METTYGSPEEEVPDDTPVPKGNLIHTSTNGDANLLQLAAAIQVLAVAAAAPPAAGPPPPVPTHVSPHEGDALNLSLCTGTPLFHDGCAALTSKCTGKVEDLHMMLADLCN